MRIIQNFGSAKDIRNHNTADQRQIHANNTVATWNFRVISSILSK